MSGIKSVAVPSGRVLSYNGYFEPFELMLNHFHVFVFPGGNTGAMQVSLDYILSTLVPRVPKAEFEYLERQTGCKANANRKSMMVLTRLCNPICNYCSDKSAMRRLHLCPKCEMTWYCSENCQRTDSAQHALWCCNPNGPRDTGPMEIRLVKVDAKGKSKVP